MFNRVWIEGATTLGIGAPVSTEFDKSDVPFATSIVPYAS